ncbi:MAG: hypothetical protein KGM24_12010 [Elusimicrobia bacterium]|nr:hypothetical protein [Elusimicrobiota bacterium]
MNNVLAPSDRRHGRALSAALEDVLGREHGGDVRRLVSAESGRRASSRRVLYWMRVNMPSAAARVDDALTGRGAWN